MYNRHHISTETTKPVLRIDETFVDAIWIHRRPSHDHLPEIRFNLHSPDLALAPKRVSPMLHREHLRSFTARNRGQHRVKSAPIARVRGHYFLKFLYCQVDITEHFFSDTP